MGNDESQKMYNSPSESESNLNKALFKFDSDSLGELYIFWLSSFPILKNLDDSVSPSLKFLLSDEL